VADLSQIPTEQLLAMLQQGGIAPSPLANVPTEQLVAMLGQQPQPARVSDEMGTGERLLAGIGRGMTSIGQGAKQLGMHAGGAVGLVDPQSVQAYDQRVADEAALFERDLGQTGAGMTGDFIGQAVATLPAGGLGGVGAKQAGKAALGQIMKHGAAQGADGFLTEKALQTGLGAATGAGGNAALRGLGTMVESLLPQNATARVLNAFNRRANESPLAQEGERLAAATGVDLTPGQVSGSKAMTAAENAARQSIHSRDIAAVGDQKRVQQLADYFDRTMTGIAKSDASPETVAQQVRAATTSTLDTLASARAKQAQADYGAVRKMAQNSVKLQPDSLRAELADLVTEHGGMGTGSSDAITAFAKRQLEGASTGGDLDKILLLRQHLSKVSGGQAKISGDNQDRMIAAKLLQAIDDDLDNNASAIGGDVGAALSTANRNYRAASQQIDSVKASPLGKILGEEFQGALQSGSFNAIAPEVVSARLNKLKPSELGVVRGLLERDNPEAWAVMKRGILQDAIEKASQIPASEGANTAVMRPSVLIKNMGDAKRLQAVFDPKELAEIQAGLDVARRLADSTGYNFSGTAAQSQLLGLMDNPLGAGKEMLNRGLGGAVGLAGAGLGSKAVARLMTDANGRAALMQLKTLPPNSAKARELTAYLATILGQDLAGSPHDGQQGQ
jgi:hypothetical protein